MLGGGVGGGAAGGVGGEGGEAECYVLLEGDMSKDKR